MAVQNTKKNNNKSFQNMVNESNNKNLQDIINTNNITKKNNQNKKKRKKKPTNTTPKKEIINEIKQEDNNIEEAKEIIKEIKEELTELKDNIEDNLDSQDERITGIEDISTEEIKEMPSEEVKELPEKVDEIKEQVVNLEHKKKNILLPILLIIIAISFIIYIILPKINLQGNNSITINYDKEYTEPGYKATFLFKDITKDIKINNKVKNGKLGTYNITYSYKLGALYFKRTRIVNIIDNKKPKVLLDDEVTICPNEEISSIKYEVFDEYDGDITSKATSEYTDDKLIITAIDSSNNQVIKEVLIKKEDKEKPIITLKGDETMYLYYGSAYYEPGYTANDNCDGDITDKVVTNGTVGTSVGTYKITYSVTDSQDNKAEVTRTIIIKNNVYYNSGSISNGTIYLTFDDGPSNGTTDVILDVLKEEGIKATFFVTCKGPDSLIKRIYDEGHTVALHTASHNYSYIYSSVDNYFADLNQVSNRVKNITGIESKIIRFPGGSSNTVSRQYKRGIMTELTNLVLEKGYRYFDWNVDSNDAGGASSSAEVYNNVIRNLSKSRSNVVLMHDIKYTTRDAIRNIIKYGKANGYNFEKIDMNTYMVRHGVNN